MNRVQAIAWSLLGTVLLTITPGCNRPETDQEPASAYERRAGVGLRVPEDMQASMGIATQIVERRLVAAQLEASGWLAVKAGNQATVKAAATGFLSPTTDQPIALGTAVAAEQALGMLRVFVSPQEAAQLVALKEETDMLIRQSLASLEVAKARHARVKELKDAGTLSGNEMELARETLERAKAAYEEASDKLPFLPSEPYQYPLQLNAVTVVAPLAGLVTQVHVQPHQLVVLGDPLWTIANWSPLWLRVPVFEGDLPGIERESPAMVTVAGTASPIVAQPSKVPLSTESGRRTVDLFYEVANDKGALCPGQAVSVLLPTGAPAKRLVLPRSAVIWGDMGQTWVYLQVSEEVFSRRRIRVGQPFGELVVVESGLAQGQAVVTAGAQALLGEELGCEVPLDDDD